LVVIRIVVKSLLLHLVDVGPVVIIVKKMY